MKAIKSTIPLLNHPQQIPIPVLGFGCWQILPNDLARASVLSALESGYRLIDTAQDYENEVGVGQAIKESGLNREELFITSKLPSHIKNAAEARENFLGSLQRLGLDYLDLYLIHAPWPWSNVGQDCTAGNIAVWEEMIKLYQEGKIRAIGVSNFQIEHLESIIQATGFVPHVNQIPLFISLPQVELRQYCTQKGIIVEAYSPLASGKLLKNESLIQMAEKYQVSVAQLCLRFCLDLGAVALPKSTSPIRIKANTQVDFKISAADRKYLLSLSYLA